MIHPSQQELHDSALGTGDSIASHTACCPDCSTEIRAFKVADTMFRGITVFSAPAGVTELVLSRIQLLRVVKRSETTLANSIVRVFWWGTGVAVSFGITAMVLQVQHASAGFSGIPKNFPGFENYVHRVASGASAPAFTLCSVLLLLVSCFFLYEKIRRARTS